MKSIIVALLPLPIVSRNIVSAGIIAYVAFWRNWPHDAVGKHALISEK